MRRQTSAEVKILSVPVLSASSAEPRRAYLPGRELMRLPVGMRWHFPACRGVLGRVVLVEKGVWLGQKGVGVGRRGVLLGRTPFLISHKGVWPTQTPCQVGKTPLRLGQTPLVLGQTSLLPTQTPLQVGRTPLWPSQTPWPASKKGSERGITRLLRIS